MNKPAVPPRVSEAVWLAIAPPKPRGRFAVPVAGGLVLVLGIVVWWTGVVSPRLAILSSGADVDGAARIVTIYAAVHNKSPIGLQVNGFSDLPGTHVVGLSVRTFPGPFGPAPPATVSFRGATIHRNADLYVAITYHVTDCGAAPRRTQLAIRYSGVLGAHTTTISEPGPSTNGSDLTGSYFQEACAPTPPA
jgi:hypothetical protein